MITFEQCAKWFNARPVLDITRHIFEAGKAHIVVGQNGSGKTTLLRLIAGLETPTRGTISRALDVRQVGYCSQRPYMFSGTVRKNVGYGLRFRSAAQPHTSADEMLERFGLLPRADRDARKLSAGEMQLTSLARTLVCSPALLLLDEPTANLDTRAVALFEEEILRCLQQQTTVIITTHIPEHLRRIPADFLRLENGGLVPAEPRQDQSY